MKNWVFYGIAVVYLLLAFLAYKQGYWKGRVDAYADMLERFKRP